MIIGRPQHLEFHGDSMRDSVYYNRIATETVAETNGKNDLGIFSTGNFKSVIAENEKELGEKLKQRIAPILDIVFRNVPGYNRNHFSFTFRYSKVENDEFWACHSYHGGSVFFAS